MSRLADIRCSQDRLIRCFDVTFSVLLLVCLAPMLLLLLGLVWLRIDGQVIFTQVRAGMGGRPFAIYKITTMRALYNGDGVLLPDSKRLTSLGQWLRRWSLDELPQLLNVLKGDLSLVGPRPLLYEYVPLYSLEQKKRLSVPAGITGWAQIHGRNDLPWKERFDLDVWYVEHRSLWLNLKILWRTIFCVLQGRGARANSQNCDDFLNSRCD